MDASNPATHINLCTHIHTLIPCSATTLKCHTDLAKQQLQCKTQKYPKPKVYGAVPLLIGRFLAVQFDNKPYWMGGGRCGPAKSEQEATKVCQWVAQLCEIIISGVLAGAMHKGKACELQSGNQERPQKRIACNVHIKDFNHNPLPNSALDSTKPHIYHVLSLSIYIYIYPPDKKTALHKNNVIIFKTVGPTIYWSICHRWPAAGPGREVPARWCTYSQTRPWRRTGGSSVPGPSSRTPPQWILPPGSGKTPLPAHAHTYIHVHVWGRQVVIFWRLR